MSEAKDHWNGYSVTSTLIAFLAMMFAGLKWYSEEQQREDKKQVQQQLEDANRRYDQLVNDQKDVLVRKNLEFINTLSKLTAQCTAQSETIDDDQRTINHLKNELSLSQIRNPSLIDANAKSTLNEGQQFTENLKTTNSVNPLIGKWSSSYLGLPVKFNFSGSGSMEEGIFGQVLKGKYHIADGNRISAELQEPLTGMSLKGNFIYFFEGDKLHLKPDQLLSMWLIYTRSED